MEPVYIYQKKGAGTAEFILLLLFLIAVPVVIFVPAAREFFSQETTAFQQLVLLIAVPFVPALFINHLFLLRNRHKPILVIDSEGITDRTGLFTVGLIRWDEIDNERGFSDKNQPKLRLDVTDTQAILDRLSPFHRLMAQGQVSRKEDSVTIELALTGLRPDEVVHKIRAARMQLTGNPMPPKPQPISPLVTPGFRKYDE